jgi:hypothetical protein
LQGTIEQFLFSIPDAGVALGGVSVRSIEYLISKGDIATRRIGGRTMVTREGIALCPCWAHVNAHFQAVTV